MTDALSNPIALCLRSPLFLLLVLVAVSAFCIAFRFRVFPFSRRSFITFIHLHGTIAIFFKRPFFVFFAKRKVLKIVGH